MPEIKLSRGTLQYRDWGMRDPFFPLQDARRLAALFAHARLEQGPEARTFVQMDAPARLAELIGGLLPVAEQAVSEKGA